MTRRHLGIGGMSLGFAITAFASFLITSANLPLGAVILRASIVFVLVVPIFGYGMYLYVTSAEPEVVESQTVKQRELLDLLHTKGILSVADAAAELTLEPDEIQVLITDLVEMQLFFGFADWDSGMIYAKAEDRPLLQ